MAHSIELTNAATAASSLWLDSRPLLLASRSQARRALLTAAGMPFEVVDVDLDERAVDEPLRARGAGAEIIAAALARAKAFAGCARHPDRLVLGADQTLALGGALMFKPHSRADAATQLLALAGRTHALHAAFCLARNGALQAEGIAVAHLTCRPFDADFVARYLDGAGDAVLETVGGYAIEGLGIHLFERIEGDHSTVLGLPLLPLLAHLRALGVCAA